MTTPGGQSISPPSGIIFHPFPPGCLALDNKKNVKVTWMSRWKLGSMVSKWVISPYFTYL